MKYQAERPPVTQQIEDIVNWVWDQINEIEEATGEGASEDWVEIGESNNPAFQNSWVNFGDPHDTAAYYKDNWGIVHLKGVVKDGTATAGTVIFTLPEEYRPYKTLVFVAISNSAIAEINVQNDGDVTIQVGANNDLSLDGIQFRAEQ